MKKLVSILLTLAVAVSLMLIPAVVGANGAPTIDGVIGTDEWSDYLWFTDNTGNEYFGGVPELTYYRANDDQYLYIATVVNDPTPLAEANDDIWLAFNDAESNYKEFRKGFTTNPGEYGKYSEEPYTSSYQALPAGVEFGWSTDDSHIYYEWKIPLTLLNVSPGETIKYLTHVREWSQRKINYHPEVTTWAPYKDINQFGEFTLQAPVLPITIDIKPGSDPNSINLKSKGVVPVAVLTTDDFDASTVDPDTVEFAGAEPVRWTMEDVDGDGDTDMLFHFKTQDLNLDGDSIEAILTGKTTDGISIEGTDTVNIIPKGKK